MASGASTKLKMPASATGIGTSRAKYMAATIITPISVALSVDENAGVDEREFTLSSSRRADRARARRTIVGS
jgi:hypothetical protein